MLCCTCGTMLHMWPHACYLNPAPPLHAPPKVHTRRLITLITALIITLITVTTTPHHTCHHRRHILHTHWLMVTGEPYTMPARVAPPGPPPPLHVPPQVHARRLACSQQVVLTVRCPLWVYNCTGMPLAIRPAVSVTDYDDGGAGGTSYGLVAGTWLPSCVGVQGSMPYSLASPRSSHTAALQVGHRGTHLLAGNQTYACRWGGRGLRGIHLRAGHQTYACRRT